MIKVLKEHFGFDRFRPGQEDVIRRITEGGSAGAIFPTGSGKSLCYQLPALQLPALTLVVSPLLALMKDQLDFLRSKGIAATTIDSTLSHEEEREIMRKIKDGEYKILLIAVERFKNERFRRFLSGVNVSLMVVDEAHCISEWGHNFRPDYLKLPVYKKEFSIKQVLLLTATATPEVIEDMCLKFDMPREAVTITGFYRKNLRLFVRSVPTGQKDEELFNILKDSPEEPSIVYVTLQKTAEEVAARLIGKGINAVAYHAGMEDIARKGIQDSFMSGRTNCIVATIAFGMGIDKRNIRRVIHYNLPKSIENYSQEIGRAGRDGLDSDCTVLANLDDVNSLENFIYGDTPEAGGIRTVLEDIPRNGSRWELRTLRLSNSSNIRILPLKTLLVYLEMKGIISPLFSYFGEYRYSNVISDSEITEKFSGERRGFVEKLFTGVKKNKVWTMVDIDEVRHKTKSDRDRVTSALEYFNQQGFIKLAAKDMVDVYEITNPDFDLEEMTAELTSLFRHREEIEVKRIGKMLAFFGSDSCLSRLLAEYFGEKMKNEKCGHCSVCLSGKTIIAKSLKLKPLDEYDFSEFTKTLSEKLGCMPGTELLTRFFCGISVPAFTKIKAKQLPGFGMLENYRYADVRKHLS